MVKRFVHELLVSRKQKSFARKHIVGTVKRGKHEFRIYCPTRLHKNGRCPIGTRAYEKLIPKTQKRKAKIPKRVYSYYYPQGATGMKKRFDLAKAYGMY